MMRTRTAAVLMAVLCVPGATLVAQRTARAGGTATTSPTAATTAKPTPAKPATATPTTATPTTATRASPASAPTSVGSTTSIGVRAGTLGVGLEVSRLLGDHIGIRVGGNYLTVNQTRTMFDVNADATFKLQSFSGMLDWYPGRRGAFHISAGAVSNPVKFSGIGIPDGGTYEINNRTYTSTQIGTYSASAQYGSVLPYVGIGFGTPASKSRGLGVVFDIGAAIGKPTIALTSSNASTVPGLQADLDAERLSVQESVNKLPVFPVVSLGFTYRF